GDFVGWAPLPPEAQFDRQTGIRNWADNYYGIGPDQYAFVSANEFGRKLTSNEILPTTRNVTIINQTTNVTNIVYNNSVIVDQGPSYQDLRAKSRQPIERYRLERTRDMTNDTPVFKGEVVALPTIDFRQAERGTRPNRVVRTIAQSVAERGWTEIQNKQEAQKARAKMESEATPPPNLPPKRFVRPEKQPNLPARPSPEKAGRPGKPTIPTANITPMGTPIPAPSTPPPSSPRPTPTAPPPAATAAPAQSAEPTPPRPAENIASPQEPDRVRRESARAAQEEKRKQREEQQAQRQAERQQKLQERRGQKPGRPEASPTATPEQPTATATPSATAEETSPSPAPTASATKQEKRAEQRKARRAEKRAERNQADSEATPTPGGQQP
ncbi:MAG: hypothetical protein ABIR29_13560, partial [Chthoniobacterales bacterium]